MKKKIFACMAIIIIMTVISGNTIHAEESNWSFNGISLDVGKECSVNTEIQISANIFGTGQGIKCKYVWMKNGWEEWGIIKDFSSETSCIWSPKASGNYWVYVDVIDSQGNLMTKSTGITVKSEDYYFQGVSSELSIHQKKGNKLNITADITGNSNGLQYKFVWMKNNWAQWGIIKEFDFEPEIEWIPTDKGEYKIFVDIMNKEGQVRTYTRDFVIKNYIWSLDAIETNVCSPQEKHNVPISIRAATTGEEGELQYKFVWMKNDWRQWGILQDFSEMNEIQWIPQNAGDYLIYVDVRDKDGEVVSECMPFTVLENWWQYEETTISPKKMQLCGKGVQISPNIAGYKEKLQYKFVWMKDKWEHWGIIQDFTEKDNVYWELPEDPGLYTLFIDIKDEEGNIHTSSVEYWGVSSMWEVSSMEIGTSGLNSELQIYTEIPLRMHLSERSESLLYEFVVEKTDGTCRQTIQPYCNKDTVIWYPKQSGEYFVRGYAKDCDGRVEMIEKKCIVNDVCWKVEDIIFDKASTIPVGQEVHINALLSGETDNLKYKYVWMKDNWADWGVLRDFGEKRDVIWRPEETGLYFLYLDIIDYRGVQFDPIIKTLNVYDFEGVGISASKLEAEQRITLYPDIRGSCTGAEFKYVWMKNGWEEWGIISDFSSASKVEWIPHSAGDYTVYIDMRTKGYDTVSKIKNIHVDAAYMTKINEIRNNYLYVPYCWGGSSPSGWDCSGFTQWSLRYLGVSIPRTAAMQAQGGQGIDPFDMSKWRPGDIICYADNSGRVSHAALYLGNGELMHALNNRLGTIIQGVDYYEWWDVVTHRVTVRRYL